MAHETTVAIFEHDKYITSYGIAVPRKVRRQQSRNNWAAKAAVSQASKEFNMPVDALRYKITEAA